MKMFECHKCGSKDIFTSSSNNQTGLYCGDCGKWIKWLTKEEIRLADRQQNIMKEKVIQQVIDSIKKGKEDL